MPSAMRCALLALVLVACSGGSHRDVDAAGGDDDDSPIADDAPPGDGSIDAFVPPAGPWRLSAGITGACAVHTDGRVKCWGGMLGYEINGFKGDAPGEMGANLPAINLGTGRTAKDVTVGTDYACALLDNDRIKCWGSNQYGQLGIG